MFLRKILGLKREEAAGGLRITNYDLHNLSSNPSILQMLRCKLCVVRMVGINGAHKTWLDCLFTRHRSILEGNIKMDFGEIM
jgi:hypothetical protein